MAVRLLIRLPASGGTSANSAGWHEREDERRAGRSSPAPRRWRPTNASAGRPRRRRPDRARRRVVSKRSTSRPAWPATAPKARTGRSRAPRPRSRVGHLLDVQPERDDRDPVPHRGEADRAGHQPKSWSSRGLPDAWRDYRVQAKAWWCRPPIDRDRCAQIGASQASRGSAPHVRSRGVHRAGEVRVRARITGSPGCR